MDLLWVSIAGFYVWFYGCCEMNGWFSSQEISSDSTTFFKSVVHFLRCAKKTIELQLMMIVLCRVWTNVQEIFGLWLHIDTYEFSYYINHAFIKTEVWILAVDTFLKFVFYKLFVISATRWVFLCRKIISNIAKSNQIFNFLLF